ncbi:MAG TPA: metallophosphoesterase family protein, partial [Candidatus Bathyarchaeia archaeon]|nr:metallophosphoesterase family protein [Candidatus Bathyarchaeia archaeon]
LILECEKVRIGVVHGDGSPQHLVEGVQEEFADERVDIVIFGHSHEAFHEKIGDVVFFNPGAPNDDMFAPYCSYGLLEVNGKKFKLKIVKVK